MKAGKPVQDAEPYPSGANQATPDIDFARLIGQPLPGRERFLPGADTDFARLIGPVARDLMGKPNPVHSRKDDLRWGTNGSMSVDLVKGVWCDHEGGVGGGTLDLIQRVKRADRAGALAWLRQHGHMQGKAEAPIQRQEIVATYDYPDESGELLYQVVRFMPKTFRPRRPNGRDGWTWNMGDVRRVLYRLPDLVAAVDAGRTIYITEGEKAADRLAAIGLAATCSPGGAGKWRPDYNAALTGAHVIILPDNDTPGQMHAEDVAKALTPETESVHIVKLPGLPHKGDVADWIGSAAGTPHEIATSLESIVTEVIAGGPVKVAEPVRPPAPEPRTRFRLMTPADLMALPERGYLLKGIMAPAELSVWWGPPKCGKSFLLMHAAYALAQGREVMGRRVKKARVLYLACEGRSGLRARIEALHARYGDAPDFVAIAEPINLHGTGDTDDLVEIIRAGRFDLVVVDTLNRVMAGGDENSSADMGAVIRNLDHIRAETGAHVALIHHGTKSGEGGPRGHGSLIGAADAIVAIAIAEDGTRTATVTDAKDDPSNRSVTFDLEVVELGTDADGDPRTTCNVVERMDAAAPKQASGKKMDEAQAGWMRDLHDAFATPGLAVARVAHADMQSMLTLTREQLRVCLRERGRFECDTHGHLTQKDRGAFRDKLNQLKDKGKIGMSAELVWLL